MKILVSYNEAVDRLIIKINECQKTLYEISEESGVSYNIIILIKNKYKKHYPNSVVKLFKYFGMKATVIKAFEIVITDN